MESSNVKPLKVRFVFSGKPPQVDTTSSVNAPLHGHKRMMHTYTRRKKAPSPVASSTPPKPPSGPVDPPPLFFPFHRGGAMESSNVKPLKVRFVFSGKPQQVDAAAAASSSACYLCPKSFSSVNALHGHMRMHRYTKRKEAPSVPVASSTQKKPSGRVDPPPLFFPFQAMESSCNVKPLKIRFFFSGKPPQVDAAASSSSAPINCSLCPKITSSVNARHSHKRMHPYTKRKDAPSVPVASSTQKKPSGPVDPTPLFCPFPRGPAMESSNVKPLKIRFVFSGKPPLVDASSAPTHCSVCPKTFSSVNALNAHMRMHRYTKRKEAPSPVASSTQKKPSGPVDPPPRLPSLVSSWSRTAKRTHRVAVETILEVSAGSGPHMEVDTDTAV